MTPEAFRALVARVWDRQAPSSRWLVVSPPATAPAAMPKKPLAQTDGKVTDVTQPTRPGGG